MTCLPGGSRPDSIPVLDRPMSSLSDFVKSVASDSLLPLLRQTFEDVVFEILNERKIPSRTDFTELRDLVNRMRGQTSSAASGAKKLGKRTDALDARLAELVEQVEAQQVTISELAEALEALRTQGGTTP